MLTLNELIRSLKTSIDALELARAKDNAELYQIARENVRIYIEMLDKRQYEL
jgi:hypothetical protein